MKTSCCPLGPSAERERTRWSPVAVYQWCSICDVLGGELRALAFTLAIIGSLNRSTVSITVKCALTASAYLFGLAVVRAFKMDRVWRWPLFIANVFMTLLSVVFAFFTMSDLLWYELILAHGVLGGVAGALSTAAAARLRHLLGGNDQSGLAWAIGSNAHLGRILSGLLAVFVMFALPRATLEHHMKATALAFFSLDALMSVPIGLFLLSIALGKIEPQRKVDLEERSKPCSLLKAFTALVKIRRLRRVFLTSIVRSFILAIPFSVEILKKDFGVLDEVVAAFGIATAAAALAGNVGGANLLARIPRHGEAVFKVLTLLTPVALFAASAAPSANLFIGSMMLFALASSPIDTLTDARLYRLPTELVARITEIRGLIDTAVKSFVWMFLSWALLSETHSARNATGVCAILGFFLLFLVCSEDVLGVVARMRRRRPLILAAVHGPHRVIAAPLVSFGCGSISTAEVTGRDDDWMWGPSLW